MFGGSQQSCSLFLENHLSVFDNEVPQGVAPMGVAVCGLGVSRNGAERQRKPSHAEELGWLACLCHLISL